MLPLSDGLPARRFPVVTIALIAANLAVWILYELPDLEGVLAVWGLTAALLAVALVAGRLAADVASEQWLGMLAAFAAGAVLASLADSVMPEAYAEGGFLVAYALTTLD